MKPISESVIEFLEAEHMQYHPIDVRDPRTFTGAYVVPFAAEHCLIPLRIHVDDSSRYVQVVASTGLKVRLRQLPKISQFILRANFALRIGVWWVSPQTSEVTFVTSAVLDNAELSPEMLARLIGTAVGVYDQYLASVIAVLFSGASVETAIQMAEGPSRERMDKTVERLLGSAPESADNGDKRLPPMKRARPRKNPPPEE